MKKIISLIFLLLISHTAFADHRGYWSGYNYRPYYGHHPYYSNNFGNFVAPALIGGIIGYQLGHPNVYYTSPSVIYNTPGTIVQQSPTVIQNSAVITNGTPLGYHTEVIKDADCNCYRNVLVRD
jgi:hypothetical protein